MLLRPVIRVYSFRRWFVMASHVHAIHELDMGKCLIVQGGCSLFQRFEVDFHCCCVLKGFFFWYVTFMGFISVVSLDVVANQLFDYYSTRVSTRVARVLLELHLYVYCSLPQTFMLLTSFSCPSQVCIPNILCTYDNVIVSNVFTTRQSG